MSRYFVFLCSMLRIGCIGFGGGSALIPVIWHEIVERQGMDTKEHIDRDVVVASITPGALPVEIAASIGRRGFGTCGMVGGAVMMALPGALLSIIFSAFLTVYARSAAPVIRVLSFAASVYICGLLFSYLRNILTEYGAGSRVRACKTFALMSGVCLLSFWFSTAAVLAVAFAGVFLISGMPKKRTAGDPWQIRADVRAIALDALAWLSFFLLLTLPAVLYDARALSFFGKGVLSAWTSFGGGDAYLSIADGFFVESGTVSTQQYYSLIVPTVNILPGSILCKTLAAVGYYAGWNLCGSVGAGLLFALGGFGSSIAASCVCFMIVYHLYDSVIRLRFFQVIRRWIRPMIGGLLMKVMVTLIRQNLMLLLDVIMG